MKKRYYAILVFYAFVTVLSIILIIFDAFNLKPEMLIGNIERLYRFIFSLIFLTVSLSLILSFVGILIYDNSYRLTVRNLHRLLNRRELIKDMSPSGLLIADLGKQIASLTQELQSKDNHFLQTSQEIINGERNRIARDLHDTVSQELFAASMIISGLSVNLDHLEKEQLAQQLVTLEGLIQTAQNDLRILLLHLRPRELDGRSLSQGFSTLVQELKEKSSLKVGFHEQCGELPQLVQEHLFRIGQEFISNTLRHSKAKTLEIYLYQTANEVQLKMIDDGIGFRLDASRSMSYGLQNIEERVKDMAGKLTILSAPNQGVTMIIKVPLIDKGEYNDTD